MDMDQIFRIEPFGGKDTLSTVTQEKGISITSHKVWLKSDQIRHGNTYREGNQKVFWQPTRKRICGEMKALFNYCWRYVLEGMHSPKCFSGMKNNNYISA